MKNKPEKKNTKNTEYSKPTLGPVEMLSLYVILPH